MGRQLTPETVSFVADCMLGRLCKWLRIIGYDAVYVPAKGRDVTVMAAKAAAEGRILLTRDTAFEKPLPGGPRCCVLKEQRWQEQLFRVKKELNLEFRESALFSRCLICNSRLVSVAEDALPADIPPAVRERNNKYFSCPVCGRHYWRGSHVSVTIEALRGLQGGSVK